MTAELLCPYSVKISKGLMLLPDELVPILYKGSMLVRHREENRYRYVGLEPADFRGLKRKTYCPLFAWRGKLFLPSEIVDYAALEGRCAVIGLINYIEFWNADTWIRYQEEVLNNKEVIERTLEWMERMEQRRRSIKRAT